MHIKMVSSRYTRAGIFRAGMVYAIGADDHAKREALAPHIKSGAAVKLDEADVASAKSDMIGRAAPVAEGEGQSTPDATAEPKKAAKASTKKAAGDA